MLRLALSGVVLGAVGCGAVVVEVKPRAVSTQIATGTNSTAVCSVEPLGGAAVDFDALAKEAGLDLSAGCLKSAAFDFVVEVDTPTGATTPTGTCAEPRGTIHVPRFAMLFTCADGTEETLTTDCPEPDLNAADGGEMFTKLNACLDAFEAQHNDALRRTINHCKPKTLRGSARGSCSADACFSVSMKLTFKLLQATAQLGGTCD